MHEPPDQAHSTERADGKAICERVRDRILEAGLWGSPDEPSSAARSHRVSPAPFQLTKETADFLRELGPALLAFYTAVNDLYIRADTDWANQYLDLGKPEEVLRHAAMRYQRRALPAVIRPDILLTSDGPMITELDSVPGGIGHLDCMSAAYEDCGFNLMGSPRGMRDGFAAIIRQAARVPDPVCAIIVSNESADYAPEMAYLACELRDSGLCAYQVSPAQVTFTEEGLYIEGDGEKLRVDVVYRFFELFDLPNIPKAELISYAARKRLTVVTPPYKHFLEEKLLLALLHSEMLEDYWIKTIGEAAYTLLIRAVSPTFILDNRPTPPHARISGFEWRGKPIRDWRQIRAGTQKERRLVIKPSGFSELAWGSRGVKVGHDMSQEEWADAIEAALESFSQNPWVLQPFQEASRWALQYYEETSGTTRETETRVRLCPYYFVSDGRADLGGVLATACPKDKKMIHGMVDAIMAPCSETGS